MTGFYLDLIPKNAVFTRVVLVAEKAFSNHRTGDLRKESLPFNWAQEVLHGQGRGRFPVGQLKQLQINVLKECHSTATTPPAARQTTLIENEIWQNESSALCSAALLQRHGRIALRQVLAIRQELAAENRDFQQEQAA